jgi:DNA-directed RNA polymerase subunit beta'
MKEVQDFDAVLIKLASPEEILSWSYGEVKRPETINYRTQRPEKDGLFAENIFGPTRDYECYCGKYKSARYKGIICDKCGVEVTLSSVRRERMGHITLAAPVVHISFLKTTPSPIALLLDKSIFQIERVVYFLAYVITKVNKEKKKALLEKIEKEFKEKLKKTKLAEEKLELRKQKKEKISEIKKLKKGEILSEEEYRQYLAKYPGLFEVKTGGEAIHELLASLNLKKLEEKLKEEYQKKKGEERKKIALRLKIVRDFIFSQVKPEWMVLKVLPVLPPDLRPMVELEGGKFASSDVNDLYRRVINRNNRLKFLQSIGAPEIILRNEKRILQEAVDALIDNTARHGSEARKIGAQRRPLKSLCDIFRGKKGRFRQNLLGKRVDYSGRSVIVVNPALKLDEAGIPRKGALELYRPFVIRKLIEKGLAHNIKKANILISEEVEEVWEALEEVTKGSYILLNRAPTLHRLSIQAFKPILVEGDAIQIHPLVCPAFNADFDGDQMAVFLPFGSEAQREAREIMISTKGILKPATGMPIALPRQDMILGCYWLTMEKEPGSQMKTFSSFEEAKIAYQHGKIELQEKIKVREESGKMLETTVGRIIFNECLPKDFPFQNTTQTSSTIQELVSDLVEKYGIEETAKILDVIKEIGFEYATLSSNTWGIDDIVTLKEKEKVIKEAEKRDEQVENEYLEGLISREERREKIIENWQEAREKILKLTQHEMRKSPIFYVVDSGARGSWAQILQMAGLKGLVVNPKGEIIEFPIKHNYKEGLSIMEYFLSTHGGRKGTVDTALRTSTAGYLTRRMVDVAHEVIVREEDCHDDEGFIIKRADAELTGQKFEEKIYGRVALEDIKIGKKIIVKKGEIIDLNKAKLIDKSEVQEVRVRSPLTCKSIYGVCQKCYGLDLATRKLVEIGTPVGLIAAQSIGEPGTQLTMRTFHAGGVAGAGDITTGLLRVEEIFEARTPKNEAVLFEEEGKVVQIKEVPGGTRIIVEVKGKRPSALKEYFVPISEGILVKKGDEVKPGQPIFESPINIKRLFELAGKERTIRYILSELQSIYRGEGVKIHDKHFEIIIRQMFSRIQIIEIGDSRFSPDEIVPKHVFEEENKKLKKAGKKPAKGKEIIRGITKVALSTDSFLSAASFQETIRVLVKSAIEGRVDFLRGLKENVIIGRLIPVGTGLKRKNEKPEPK